MHGSKAYRTLAAIQDTAASVDASGQRRQSDKYTLPTSVLAHEQHTYTAVQRALLHVWQSLDTRGQSVKMASPSESSDQDDNLVLFCCWC